MIDDPYNIDAVHLYSHNNYDKVVRDKKQQEFLVKNEFDFSDINNYQIICYDREETEILRSIFMNDPVCEHIFSIYEAEDVFEHENSQLLFNIDDNKLSINTRYNGDYIFQIESNNITKVLLEFGRGFAYVGHQYHLEVAGEDYYIDLLFYNIKLKCYVVIELKIGEFKPEYACQLSFYLTAIDEQIKEVNDNPTIGLLLCRYKNNVVAEYTLKDMNKPMGISEYKIKDYLPSIEELITIVKKEI